MHELNPEEGSIFVDYGLVEWFGYYKERPNFPSISEVQSSFPNIRLGPVPAPTTSDSEGYLFQPLEVQHPETIPDMTVRFQTFLARLEQRLASTPSSPTRVLLVTHGYGVQNIVQHLCPGSDILETPECCLSKLVKKRRQRMKTWNNGQETIKSEEEPIVYEEVWVAERVADASHYKHLSNK
jgi:broad specificity phosphatase PhoE